MASELVEVFVHVCKHAIRQFETNKHLESIGFLRQADMSFDHCGFVWNWPAMPCWSCRAMASHDVDLFSSLRFISKLRWNQVHLAKRTKHHKKTWRFTCVPMSWIANRYTFRNLGFKHMGMQLGMQCYIKHLLAYPYAWTLNFRNCIDLQLTTHQPPESFSSCSLEPQVYRILKWWNGEFPYWIRNHFLRVRDLNFSLGKSGRFRTSGSTFWSRSTGGRFDWFCSGTYPEV